MDVGCPEWQDGMDPPFFQCHFCTVTETSKKALKRCSGCQLVTYCSKVCQEDDWKVHKHICKKFRVVNGKNVYHTTMPWELHIFSLHEKAEAQVPEDHWGYVSQIFDHPKVCKTCHEPQPDRLKVCKCNIFAFCSEKCAKKDKRHMKACNDLCSQMKASFEANLRFSYPGSFWHFLEELDESGFRFSKATGVMDLGVMEMHIVTNKAYYDALAWGWLFEKLPKMNILDLTFILQGGPYDKSLNCYRKTIPHPGYKTNKKYIVYSIYQMPYHMYFSSPSYNEADFVVTFGISDEKMDAQNKISYRNMTNYSSSVLVLMDSTKDLVTRAVEDVKEVQPTSVVLLQPRRNQSRGFGGLNAHHTKVNFNGKNSEIDFNVDAYDADAPNLKTYMAGLHRPSGEKCEPFFLKHFKPLLKDATDPLREILMKNNGVPEGHL